MLPTRSVEKISVPEIPVEYKYLAVLMGLPLIDGVFISIILTGGLNSLLDAVIVGTFVLGGGAVVSVILSEFNDSAQNSIKRILIFSIFVGIIATIQAIAAPTIEQFIDTSILKYGAFLAIVSIAVDVFPKMNSKAVISPVYILAPFVLLSIDITQLNNIELILYNTNNPKPFYAAFATFISMIICITTVILRPKIKQVISINQIKILTSIGLMLIGLNILGILPTIVQPIYFLLAVVLATVY